MRILHLTSHLNTGGITRYVALLATRHAAQGHAVIVASDGGSAQPLLQAAGATHWHVPLRTSAEFSPQVWWTIRILTARLRHDPVDIIHAHTRVGQVVADRLSRRLGIPYVTTWHGVYRRRLGRRLWPCTGAITIAISGLVRDYLLDECHIPAARVRLIYNGVDTAWYGMAPDAQAVGAFRARWRLPAGQPIIGTVGRIASGKVKGFDTLLAAASLLEDLVPAFHLLIVGDGPRRPFIEDIAQRLGLRDRVRFVGETQDVRVPLAVMDLFLFTSRWPEAFGLTLIEAMAVGKPVVATRAGAVPEVIRHEVDGLLVSSDDPQAMADSIARLLKDPITAQRLAQSGRHRVREAFDLARVAVEVEAVYREALHSSAPDNRTHSG